VASAYEDAAETGSRMWRNQVTSERIWESLRLRADTDAQAARDARDKRIREEALREAANVAHDAVLDNGDDQVQVRFAVLALIEKEQTDE